MLIVEIAVGILLGGLLLVGALKYWSAISNGLAILTVFAVIAGFPCWVLSFLINFISDKLGVYFDPMPGYLGVVTFAFGMMIGTAGSKYNATAEKFYVLFIMLGGWIMLGWIIGAAHEINVNLHGTAQKIARLEHDLQFWFWGSILIGGAHAINTVFIKPNQ